MQRLRFLVYQGTGFSWKEWETLYLQGSSLSAFCGSPDLQKEDFGVH